MGWLQSVVAAVAGVVRPRSALILENLAYRQQLAMLKRRHPRLRATALDRAFWVALSRAWSGWANALIVVKPETVVGWHRQAYRRFWTWISRSRRPGAPRIAEDVRRVIRRLARENPGWGAPRIHGELLKLGLAVSERTVARYLPKRRPDPGAVERWKAFLRNHREGIAAMDFFVVPTVTFRLLYGMVFIDHGRRRIVHFNVTEHPSSEWVVRQIREAFPYDEAPPHLIFDRDSIFNERVAGAIRQMGTKPVRTAYRAPWQNPVVERFIGTVRREILDHVVVFGEGHLRRLMRDFIAYYHADRTHLGLEKDCPVPRAVIPRASKEDDLVALPRVGGIHHRYEWRKRA